VNILSSLKFVFLAFFGKPRRRNAHQEEKKEEGKKGQRKPF